MKIPNWVREETRQRPFDKQRVLRFVVILASILSILFGAWMLHPVCPGSPGMWEVGSGTPYLGFVVLGVGLLFEVALKEGRARQKEDGL